MTSVAAKARGLSSSSLLLYFFTKSLTDHDISNNNIRPRPYHESNSALFEDDIMPSNTITDTDALAFLAEDIVRNNRLAEERNTLRADIENLIKPWRTRNAKPPFSTGELTVMAILISNQPCLTTEDILLMIVKTFPFYRTKALKEYVVAASCDGGRCNTPETVVHGFPDVLSQYEIPLTDHKYDNTLTAVNCDEGHITVPTREGRIFLRHLLEPARKGAFPFLRLPAELRNAIYELAFTFPRSGFRVCQQGVHSGKSVELRLQEREHEAGEREFQDWVDDPEYCVGDETVELRPLDSVLALLQVNKQVYAEAVSYFCGKNSFYFADADDLGAFFHRGPASRVKRLKHIHARLEWSGARDFIRMASLKDKFLAVEELRKLTMK